MAMTVLKALPSPPGIPVRSYVDLLVQVNETHCSAPRYVSKLHDKWVRTTIHSIVAHAAAHFQGAPVAGKSSATVEDRMRQSWSRLCDFSPRSEVHEGKKRLLITPGDNVDVRAEMSQLLGVGVGLAVLCSKLQIPFSGIRKQNFNAKTFHDFEAFRKGKLVKIEVRGRYRANNRDKALTQIHKKFELDRNFSSAIGAQVYPFNVADRSRPDVELIDPLSDSGVPDLGRLARGVILHYLPYLERQNVHGAVLLRMLVELPDELFPHFFRTTWRRVWKSILDSSATPGPLGRVAMNCSGARYLGSFYNGWAAPPWAADYVEGYQKGYAFMGLPHSVFHQFTTIEDTIGLLEYVPPIAYSANGLVYVRLGDGFLLVWSPTLEKLVNHK